MEEEFFGKVQFYAAADKILSSRALTINWRPIFYSAFKDFHFSAVRQQMSRSVQKISPEIWSFPNGVGRGQITLYESFCEQISNLQGEVWVHFEQQWLAIFTFNPFSFHSISSPLTFHISKLAFKAESFIAEIIMIYIVHFWRHRNPCVGSWKRNSGARFGGAWIFEASDIVDNSICRCLPAFLDLHGGAWDEIFQLADL